MQPAAFLHVLTELRAKAAINFVDDENKEHELNITREQYEGLILDLLQRCLSLSTYDFTDHHAPLP